MVRSASAAVTAGFWAVVMFGSTATAVVRCGVEVTVVAAADVEGVVAVVVAVGPVSKAAAEFTDTDESRNDESLQADATSAVTVTVTTPAKPGFRVQAAAGSGYNRTYAHADNSA